MRCASTIVTDRNGNPARCRLQSERLLVTAAVCRWSESPAANKATDVIRGVSMPGIIDSRTMVVHRHLADRQCVLLLTPSRAETIPKHSTNSARLAAPHIVRHHCDAPAQVRQIKRRRSVPAPVGRSEQSEQCRVSGTRNCLSVGERETAVGSVRRPVVEARAQRHVVGVAKEPLQIKAPSALL